MQYHPVNALRQFLCAALSVSDHDAIAEKLIRFIDDRK